MPGLYERRTIHLSAAGQEVNVPSDYGLNDAFPVVMAGKVVENAIFVHLLGNAAAMSGGVQTDVLIQFAKP